MREERRCASGEAQAEEERQRREQLIIDSVFKAEGAVEEGAEEGAEELMSAEEAAAEAAAALGGGVVERDVSGLLDAMFAAPEFEEEERAGRADAA